MFNVIAFLVMIFSPDKLLCVGKCDGKITTSLLDHCRNESVAWAFSLILLPPFHTLDPFFKKQSGNSYHNPEGFNGAVN